MREIDDDADELRPGHTVKVRIRGHEPWGLPVAIVGHEEIGASIDYRDIAGPLKGWPRPDDFPVGAEIEAVIMNRAHGSEPPLWYYLMIP